MRTARIEPRFRGPNNSGNGGYSAGLLGREFDGAAEVRLAVPPPLETDLELDWEEDRLTARAGDTIVATARSAELDLDVPDPPPADLAEASEGHWPEGLHPFPECFACGPHRGDADGLRIFPGPVAGRDPLRAALWRPDASLPQTDGAVAKEIVWAALDCPTGWAAARPGHPAVLAGLTGTVRAPVRPGAGVVVTAWPLGFEGRKRWAAAALHSADGELLACSRGLWIELKDPAAFESAV